MIYDKDGNVLSVCYDEMGNALTQAYDKDGEIAFAAGDLLTVMTYNVGDWGYMNNQVAMQQAIISKYKPDIIGLQEYASSLPAPAIAGTVFADYNVTPSYHKNFIALAEKGHSLSNVVIADFESQAEEDWTQWGETRAYIKADITIGGKTITLFNTHLCQPNRTVKYQQMAELFEMANQCDYAVLMGDWNCAGYASLEDAEYASMFKMWIDAGYNLANHKGDLNYVKTISTTTTATSLSEFNAPCDDIIVSSNIEILKTVFDITKLSYLNGKMIDHIPVVCTLLVH